MSPRRPERRTLLACGTVAGVALFWWTGTDRLDLPKLAALLLATLLLGALGLARGRGVGLAACLGSGLAVLALLVDRAEGAARIEGWAGWLAALLLFGAAREAEPRDTLAPLGGLALGLAGVGLLQSLGVELFTGGLSGLGGRRVVGTLGGPGHFGWTLAALLPFAGAWLMSCWGGRRTVLMRVATVAGVGAVFAALASSGSRTGWAMALVGLPAWVGRRRLAPVGLAVILGLTTAVAIDTLGGRARLGQRAADLTAVDGTASGRFYLWRVYGASLPEVLGTGHGPEGFQRIWPRLQAAFLAARPEAAIFRSDLRHAHADAVEILIDFGVIGGVSFLAFLLWLARRGWRSRAAEPAVDPAIGAVAAIAVGGLAAPVLHFAPTLAIAALAAGLAAGPPRRTLPRALAVLALVGPLLAGVALGERLRSEVWRSAATAARLRGDSDSHALAQRAVSIDPRNPRASLEVALAATAVGDLVAAQDALRATARDLPTDEVRDALAAVDATVERRAPPKADRSGIQPPSEPRD